MKPLFTIFFLLVCLSGYTQIKTLKSHDYMRMQMQSDSTLSDRMLFIEREVQHKLRNNLNESGMTIPVIIHVIHQGGIDSISRDQINSQILALNRDFNQAPILTNHPSIYSENFDRLAINMGISFCLADISFGDTSHPGINYIYGTETDWGLNNDIKDGMMGCVPYQPSHYLNIWVSELADTVGGFAQMPGGDSITDGIVIDHRMFGTVGTAEMPFHEGKCLTRLVGNYLGLYDIFGMTYCSDDYVRDTPKTNGPNYGCPGPNHISICGSAPFHIEMTMNFMDATNDECRCMFTEGQMQRIFAHLSISGARQHLLSNTYNCIN